MIEISSKIQAAYKNKTILITGAGGYIGSHLVDALSKIDCHIIRFSRKKLAEKNNCVATIQDIRADLIEFNDWENLLYNTNIIFHLAAQTSVTTADDFPVKDAEINIIGLLKILESAKKLGNKTLVLAGSATECGLQEKLPVDEKVMDMPVSLYDLNKLIAEKYLHYFCKNNWIRGTCLRLCNVYGPGVQSSNRSRGVLNQVIQNALLGKEIITFGGGEFIRDYIYISDVIAAFLFSGANIENLGQPHYVIGSGVGKTIKEAFDLIAQKVKEKTGVAVLRSDRPFPEDYSIADCRNFIANSTAFSNATHWKPQYTLLQGIINTIAQYKREEIILYDK